jgi:hypothetical protein
MGPTLPCSVTGGQHRGWHLFYLTDFPVRKRGMLAYRSAAIDLMGSGSFVVLPPSVVEAPYRLRLGFDEIASLPQQTYDDLLSLLGRWKAVNRLLRHLQAERQTADDVRAALADAPYSDAMRDYAEVALSAP